MRKHKFMFSVFREFRWAIQVDDVYTIDGIYQYLYWNTKISAGNVYKVDEVTYHKEVKNYYAISIKKARGRGRRGFWMAMLTEEGFEYFKELAIENRLRGTL